MPPAAKPTSKRSGGFPLARLLCQTERDRPSQGPQGQQHTALDHATSCVKVRTIWRPMLLSSQYTARCKVLRLSQITRSPTVQRWR